ncbi:HS12A-like protein [Mya arenaria]|uniref:HS12A-like protein n=1 Tax=Mya arenaria TaxID=6604 RepID=A0ABY7DNG1_MYAAR|nr:HS12A-like protein [Mya arenaria]
MDESLLVLAIDFGTTYSGYAFSFRSDPLRIQTNQSWSQKLVSLKTPTVLLVDEDRKFQAFGYEAEEKYAELLEDCEADGWALLRRFKMSLYHTEAGIPRAQLGMALESEAASVWCQTVPLVIPAEDDRYALTNVDSKYMVVDLGGGTADITVHQKLANGKLRELDSASGGSWGGTQVDKRFIAMLAQCLGEETMKKFHRECLQDVFDLIREFETTKRTLTPETTGMVRVRLPASLHELRKSFDEEMPKTQLRNQFLTTIRNSQYGDNFSVKGDKLRVNAGFMRHMFDHSIDSLISKIGEILEKPEVGRLENILVVGGFSECALVQHSMRQRLRGKKIIFPPEAGLAVLKGAVLYGHNPQIIASRVARFTYGLKTTEEFDETKHKHKYKVVKNGVAFCSNLFQIYVFKGDEVETGQVITKKHKPKDNQNPGGYVTFEMYLSTTDSATYVTDPSCYALGKLEVRMPEDANTAYETSLIFGDTEIMLKRWAKHLTSLKTPTVLLLNQSKEFDSFGYEAEERYADLLLDESDEGWMLFRKFKMILYQNTAGIPRNQLVMALESEAASVWCQRVPVAMDKSAFTQDNSRYMVVDLGGGTADITVHQKLRTGQLKQLCADFGGKWGGQEVDNNFVQLLTRCLGREAMNTFYDECLHDVFDLLREFEMTKRSVAPTENGKVRIRLPVSLTEITQKKLSKSKGRELFLKSLIASDYGDKVSIAKDKLKIDAEIIKRMFVDCISKTIDAIKDKFKGDPRISDVKNVLVVGGFAECAIVQAEMKERLLKVKKKLVFPPEAGLAVLNGAVLFGHEPTIIASRKTRFTYGLKRKTDGKNTFHIFIEKEEEYTNGHVVTVNDWPLLDKKGGYATFELFMSTSKTPTLVTDPTCKNVGKLEMKVHNSCTACEVSLVFDTDAVMLRIKEPETGDVITKMFDFI